MKKLFQFKAIETRYQGYRMRSRLEARWGTFFDELGIPYEYEKEGYSLNGTPYLPDFWLPEKRCWVEIKGEKPTEEEICKAKSLALYTGYEVFIFSGNISMPDQENQPEITCYSPPIFLLYTEQHELIEREVSPPILSILDSLTMVDLGIKLVNKSLWIEPMVACDGVHHLDKFIKVLQMQHDALQEIAPLIKQYEDELMETLTVEDGWSIEFEPSEVIDGCGIRECTQCHHILFSRTGKYHTCSGTNSDTNFTKNDTPRLIEAYTAARSARF